MKIHAMSAIVIAQFTFMVHPVKGYAGEGQEANGSVSSKAISPWVDAASTYDLAPINLYALAFAESRRRCSDGALRPWPWTLNTPSRRGMYFETYDAALAALKELLAQGITNIDIGLMGINWRWNGYRLPDPEKLLLPKNNIKVAAEILREHLDRFNGDLRLALARYHNPKDELGIPYAESVLTILDHLSRLDGVKSDLLKVSNPK